jgi:CspA family cold shock protein
VHYSSIGGEGYKTLTGGEEVQFEVVDGPKGPQALDVSKR